MDYQEYLRPDLLVLIPVLYLVGIVLKKSRCPDRFIPLILGTLSIVLCALRILESTEIQSERTLASVVFMSLTQGILLAGASVYANQLYMQMKKPSAKETENQNGSE